MISTNTWFFFSPKDRYHVHIHVYKYACVSGFLLEKLFQKREVCKTTINQ
jgi:hypothetical protein